MRITIKTCSGRCAEIWNKEGKTGAATAASLDGELLPLSDLDWMRDEGFADYVTGLIEGIEQPQMLPANGEISI